MSSKHSQSRGNNKSIKMERIKFNEYKLAIQDDISKLLEMFETSESFSFKDFSRYWCCSKFSLIYLGKHRSYEVATFTQLLFHCAKKFLLFPESKIIKVGALFVLYGLYYKQPFKELCRIRILKDEFKLLVNLINEMRNAKHLDPVYVYSKLLKDNAFDFVYTQFIFGPNTFYSSYDLQIYNDIAIGSCNIEKEVKAVANKGLKVAEDINNEYQKLLSEYLESQKNTEFSRHEFTLKDDSESVLNPQEINETAHTSLQKVIKNKAFKQRSKKLAAYRSIHDKDNESETDSE